MPQSTKQINEGEGAQAATEQLLEEASPQQNNFMFKPIDESSMGGESVTPQHENTRPVEQAFGETVTELDMRSEESKDYGI